MPRSIRGKKLSAKQHRQWKHVYEGELASGLSKDKAAAAATSQVKKSMRKRGKKK